MMTAYTPEFSSSKFFHVTELGIETFLNLSEHVISYDKNSCQDDSQLITLPSLQLRGYRDGTRRVRPRNGRISREV